MKTNTSQPGELWQTTHQWLSASGNTIDKKFCREELTTHPDYPAMTAITDFLESGNMAYNAVQSDPAYIHEFNYPALAHIRQPGQEYMHIISNAGQWDQQKEITSHWSGIVVFPEKNTQWLNEQNNSYHQTAIKNKAISGGLIFVAACLFIISVFSVTNFYSVLFGLFSLIGLIISVCLLGAELGYQGQLIKQVCGAVSKGGCENV